MLPIGICETTIGWPTVVVPFVVLPSSDGYPIQVGLSLVGRLALPLATVISTFPIVVLFLIAQRYLSSGRTTGGLDRGLDHVNTCDVLTVN